MAPKWSGAFRSSGLLYSWLLRGIPDCPVSVGEWSSILAFFLPMRPPYVSVRDLPVHCIGKRRTFWCHFPPSTVATPRLNASRYCAWSGVGARHNHSMSGHTKTLLERTGMPARSKSSAAS